MQLTTATSRCAGCCWASSRTQHARTQTTARHCGLQLLLTPSILERPASTKCVCDITKGGSTGWILNHLYPSKKQGKRRTNRRATSQEREGHTNKQKEESTRLTLKPGPQNEQKAKKNDRPKVTQRRNQRRRRLTPQHDKCTKRVPATRPAQKTKTPRTMAYHPPRYQWQPGVVRG